jgi:hypothetical protein
MGIFDWLFAEQTLPKGTLAGDLLDSLENKPEEWTYNPPHHNFLYHKSGVELFCCHSVELRPSSIYFGGKERKLLARAFWKVIEAKKYQMASEQFGVKPAPAPKPEAVAKPQEVEVEAAVEGRWDAI